MAEPPPRDPPSDPTDETVVVPPRDEPVIVDEWGPEDDVFVESDVVVEETETVPPRETPLIWPWLLALLLVVLGGLGAYYFLTQEDTNDVPAVVGQRQERAEATVREAGFEPKVERAESAKPRGIVLDQAPDAGDELEEGKTVLLTVSQGPARETVPDVVGETEPEATAALTASGFEADVTEEFSDKKAGVVVSQEPKGGANLKEGSVVALTVSKGSKPVTVPDVVGTTSSQATATLRGVGLRVNVVGVPSDQPSGTVVAQSPVAGKQAKSGGTVRLNVAQAAAETPAHGERAVLRLLDKEGGKLELQGLGMDAATLRRVDELIHRPHGIVLVTGPTGSGKTTTLYAALSRIDALGLNIMTVEDPIEYELDGISQTQVNPKIGMDFARALRSILRHDPDVIMIGEIRDLETAQIAVQASLTGHLVLATLHTNDSVSATTRLVDMGVEPYLLSSSLLGVLAQRLVRKLCVGCKVPGGAGIGVPPELQSGNLYLPAGCAACAGTGYVGRTGIYELLTIDDALRRLICKPDAEPLLRAHAAERGLRTLREDGMRWVADGTTSLEEVVRVSRES